MSTPATPATAASTAQSLRPLLARITRDQGPENEQSLTFAALTQVSTPTSLRTDRKIKWLDFHMRGRFTNAATGPTLRTGPLLLNALFANTGYTAPAAATNSSIIFSLIQQITIRGQHLKYGSQTVVQMRGEACAEFLALMLPNYVPQYSISQNGGALLKFGPIDTTAAHTNDFDFVLPVPLYPPDISSADSVMYCIHGPDWPGNFYVDLLFADGTALATANPPTSFTAFGSATGSPSVQILSERPLLGKDYMSSIRGAITFRVTFSSQPTLVVSTAGGTGVQLQPLQVGKDTTRIFLKTGVQGTGESAGVVAYGSLSDLICTNTFFSLDSRQLRFQGTNGDPALQDYMARSYYRWIPAGYRMIDFISNTGMGPANPKSAFGSSQLTAARKFELDADTTSAANQIAEVVQEMLLGAPGITTASAAASTTTTGS
jgi:hypothetical protein